MNRSSGLRAYDKTKLRQKTMNFNFWSHLSSQAIARIINFSRNNLPVLGFYRRIIEWNKIFMSILQRQKEMFYWSNVNIRQTMRSCHSQTMQTLKQRFFTDIKQKQNVKFLYQANVKKQIGYKYQRQLFRTNQYFIVNIIPRGKSCFVKLKIVSMAERIKG